MSTIELDKLQKEVDSFTELYELTADQVDAVKAKLVKVEGGTIFQVPLDSILKDIKVLPE